MDKRLLMICLGLLSHLFYSCADQSFVFREIKLENTPVFEHARGGGMYSEGLGSPPQSTHPRRVKHETESPGLIVEGVEVPNPSELQPGTPISGQIIEGLIPHSEIIKNTLPATGSKLNFRLPILRICSDSASRAPGGGIRNTQFSDMISLSVFDSMGKLVCVDQTKDYRSDLINLGQLEIKVPCKLGDGQYTIHYSDPRDLFRDHPLAEIEILKKGSQVLVMEDELKILYATSSKDKKFSSFANEDYSRCDKHNSPLVVKLKQDTPLRLSSIEDGIEFDIEGLRGSHIKKQISWPTDDTIAFIALPNAQGVVQGVNQLFGDNTLGPDGRFAKDGYAALAKYDSNKDGRINKADLIFEELRLFIDRNRDGNSQPDELSMMSEHGILEIDLNYDPNYAEIDQYGNKILFKSFAKSTQGDLLVFDIWFRTAPY